MNIFRTILVIFTTTLFFSAKAQHVRFVTQGSIEFEKRVNSYVLIKEQVKNWGDDSFYTTAIENYQKNNPQFKIQKSTLYFNTAQSAFIPVEDAVLSTGWFSDIPALKQNNTTLNDLKSAISKTNKKVYDETYIVTDSVRKINWKITDEIRNIAGYNCRRANAIIMDSVYVVAFYTEEIAVSAGPESFTGLPGMILGLALPHDHVTWFATSVTDAPVAADKFKIPTKGKPVNKQQLTELLNKALKSWGKSGREILKWAFM